MLRQLPPALYYKPTELRAPAACMHVQHVLHVSHARMAPHAHAGLMQLHVDVLASSSSLCQLPNLRHLSVRELHGPDLLPALRALTHLSIGSGTVLHEAFLN